MFWGLLLDLITAKERISKRQDRSVEIIQAKNKEKKSEGKNRTQHLRAVQENMEEEGWENK